MTEAFAAAARLRAEALGMPHHALVLVPHPLASRPAEQVAAVARAAAPRVVEALTAPAPAAPAGMAGEEAGVGRRVELPGDLDAFQDAAEARGWSDGLPLVPPTEARVGRLLEAAGLEAGVVLGVLAPRNSTVTAEKLAANAVMAGARPVHMPVVVAAVRAALRPEFNAGGLAVTTGGGAPLVIVSGPAAARAGIHGGTACFGSGWRGNAVVGRALRLVMRNLGGAVPGAMKKSTQAFPAEYSFCVAEAEDGPWPPLRVELGYPAGRSTVSLAGVRSFHQVTEHTVTDGGGILDTLAGSMRTWGAVSYYYQGRRGQVLVVLCPEHAAEIAAAGHDRAAVRRVLHQRARLPRRELVGRGNYGERTWPEWIEAAADDAGIPIVADPADFLIIVAGGSGRHSSWLPLWSATWLTTEPVAP